MAMWNGYSLPHQQFGGVMKVGDLVRFKDWHGGFIGECIEVSKMWSGEIHYVIRWFDDGSTTQEYNSDLVVINENR